MKTKQCFIHLNTKELRERIEKENIKIAHTSITESREYGLLFNGKLVLGTPKYLDNRTITEYLTEFKKDIKDCGTDQEMFIQTIKKIQNQLLPAKAREYAVSPKGLSGFSG